MDDFPADGLIEYVDAAEYARGREIEEEPPIIALNEISLSQIKRNRPGLSSVSFLGGDSDTIDWEENARFIGENTHLTLLSIDEYNEEEGDERSSLNFAQFCAGVSSNSSIEELRFSGCTLEGADYGSPAAAALENLSPLFEDNVLRSLEVNGCVIGASLPANIEKCNSLERIKIKDLVICDRLASEIIEALEGKSSLSKIDLCGENDGDAWYGGIYALGNLLQHRRCSVSELDLRMNHIDKTCATFLGKSLAKCKTLRRLNLSGNNLSMAPDAWLPFARHLQKHSCFMLEELDVSGNNIDDEALSLIGGASATGTTLKSLNLSTNARIGQEAWRAFIGDISVLEELHMSYNNMSDALLVDLADALTNNTSLKRLHLCGTGLNDDGVILLKGALMHNSTLQVLDIAGNTGLRMRSLDAISTLTCDNSSIDQTYSSNHTLQSLGDRVHVPVQFDFGLAWNKEDDKREVARQKIIQKHLLIFPRSGHAAVNVRVFCDMELNVLPRAISWMGRDRIGLELLYNLLPTLPSLFCHCNRMADSRKRKRGA